jgi:hypothetical protein
VKPLAINLQSDGTGSAAFGWDQTVPLVSESLRAALEPEVGAVVTVLGIRFVDCDGRVTAGPVPDGMVLVGFTTKAV